MNPRNTADDDKRQQYITKLVLITVFLGALASFLIYMTFYGPGLAAFQLGAMDLVLLSLATFRLGRLISYDRVMEPLRQFFTETVPDPTGAGDNVVPKGVGVQNSLGQLICCPICAGTWVAAGLVYLLYLFPDATRVFMTIMAVVGAAELFNAVTEAWSWTGQHKRVLSGQPNLERQAAEGEAPGHDGLVEPAPKSNALARVDHRTAALAQQQALINQSSLGDGGYSDECPENDKVFQQQQKARRIKPVDPEWQDKR